MNRVRNYCFTSYVGKIQFNDNMKYLVQGIEICPTTGKEHIQGFVIFKNGRTFTAVKKEFDNSIHWEVAKGNIEQNRAYCMKDKNYTEEGEIPKGNGHRTDLETVANMIRNGATSTDIINRVETTEEGKVKDYGMDYIRYNRGIEKMINLVKLRPRDWEMDVRIYWGAPGTGKTRAVFDEFGQDKIYTKMVGKWWDGYQGEECVLIDDFDPKNCFDITFDFYLKLLDRYKLLIEMKGSTGQFCSKTIIFTSNFDPETWFLDRPNRQAFFRRVKVIKNFLHTAHCTEVAGVILDPACADLEPFEI